MNDLNLRFERDRSARHKNYLKEQANRRAVDDAIAMAEAECMDQYYACRVSDWMNRQAPFWLVEKDFTSHFSKRYKALLIWE